MEERNIFSDFSDKDLQDLINFGGKTLSYQQIDEIKKEIANRNITPVKEKVKVKMLTKEYNGFTSLLVLSLITGLAGMSTFMYILLSIGG